MSRDPSRIRPFLDKLAEFWERNPDWRFGQTFYNLTRGDDGHIRDAWEWDVENFERAMQEFKEEKDMTLSELAARIRVAVPAELRSDHRINAIIQHAAEERWRQLHAEY